MNAYKWARAVLRTRSPPSYLEVQKLEADSKFFRSLFVALLLAALFGGTVKDNPLPGPAYLFGAVLCYWRYAERRESGINEAYRSVIVLFTLDAGQRAEQTESIVANGVDSV